MANFVLNKITLHGNPDTIALVAEMVRRFNADRKLNKGVDDGGAVGRVLYGRVGNDANLGYELTGARRVYVDDYIKDGKTFCFSSSWEPINGLQDHILKYASIIDPSVVVINKYVDEGPSFFGCRIITCEDDDFQVFEFREDSKHLKIGHADDLDAVDHPYQMTWDELNEMIEARKMDLINDLIQQTHSVERDYFL